MVNKISEKEYYTSAEVAKLLGVSRIAVYKRIKSGSLPARKIGRNYVVHGATIDHLFPRQLTASDRQFINRAVNKTVEDFGEALKKLGYE